MNIYNLKNIIDLSREPDEKQFEEWLLQAEVIPFLQKEILDENIILYASLPHVFIYSVLIPKIDLKLDVINDLLKWDISPHSSWGIASVSNEIWIESPFFGAESEILQKGEQIIFERDFKGNISQKSYYELNQKLAHVLNLHHISERKAWCKLDEFGEIEDIVKIFETKELSKDNSGVIISMRKAALAVYACLQNSSLLRMYDFTRYKPDNFSGWGGGSCLEFTDKEFIFGNIIIQPNIGSYSKGVQLADIAVSKEQIICQFLGSKEQNEAKKYVSFIAQDWKNNRITEISCDPSGLANYFIESELPFDVTPVFFRPEVLVKYKADKDKYWLDNRSVQCRDAWHLKTFDINEAGQVHTYLIYLSQLPYEEQLHWRQYNETPKAPISARAYQTDYEGKFSTQVDPLWSLKQALERINQQKPGWWLLRNDKLIRGVHYPFTNSRDEWADEILNLDQLLVEGFEEKWLREKAIELKRELKKEYRALKLLEECLIGLGFEESYACKIMCPFYAVHRLRSMVKSHTQGREAEEQRRKAIEEFGSFRKHFEKLCADCNISLIIIKEAFGK